MGDIKAPVPAQPSKIAPPAPPLAPASKNPDGIGLASTQQNMPQARKSRRYPPDLTGFYEHRPQSGKGSGLVLQLNQAGRVVVGWFAPPPPFVPGNLVSDTRSRKSDLNGTRMLPGVLVAFIPEGSFPLNGINVAWRTTPNNTKPDPAEPMAMFLLDPPDVFLDKHHDGLLRIIEGPYHEIGFEVALCFEYTSSFPIKDLSQYDIFVRVNSNARLANDSIQNFAPEVQAKLLAEQVAPLSDSYIQIIKSRIAPLTTERSPVDPLLEAWWKNSNHLERLKSRENLTNYIRAALETDSVKSVYAEILYHHVRALAAWKNLTIGDKKKSYLEWYQLLLAEELDHQRELKKANPKTAPLLSSVPLVVALKNVGIAVSGEFQYTFSFQEVGPNLVEGLLGQMSKYLKPKMEVVPGVGSNPDSLLERDVIKGMKPGAAKSVATDAESLFQLVKLKGAIIKMDVKKEKVKVDSSGVPILKKGIPEVDSSYSGGFDTAGKLTSPSSLVTNGFAGFMGDLGAGIKLEGSLGKFAVSGSLKQTVISSSLDLAVEDFAYCSIRGVLLAGPQAKFSDYLSLNVFSSRFFEVILSSENGGFVLSTSETESFKLKKIELGDLKPGFKTNVQEMIDDYNKKWTQPQIEARIIELSGSFAWVFPLFDASKKTLQVNQKVASGPRKRVAKYSSVQTEAFFKTNAANLDDPVVGDTSTASIMQQYGLKSRDLLELSLATHLAFFTSSDASMVTVGFTSPEQPTDANQLLSERRAKAVEDVVKDALATKLKIKPEHMKSAGKGESLALSSGLKDPEASGLTRAQFIQQFPKEVAEWPFYRRVDLFVDDVIVASVKG